MILPWSGYVWRSRFNSHVRCCCLGANVRVWDENARKHDRYQFPEDINDSSKGKAIRVRVKQCVQRVSVAIKSSTTCHNQARLVSPSNRAQLVITKLYWCVHQTTEAQRPWRWRFLSETLESAAKEAPPDLAKRVLNLEISGNTWKMKMRE